MDMETAESDMAVPAPEVDMNGINSGGEKRPASAASGNEQAEPAPEATAEPSTSPPPEKKARIQDEDITDPATDNADAASELPAQAETADKNEDKMAENAEEKSAVENDDTDDIVVPVNVAENADSLSDIAEKSPDVADESADKTNVAEETAESSDKTDPKVEDGAEKQPEGEDGAKKEPKKSPELVKLWKTVESDPADFTGWTYLLQHVDGVDVEMGREAYDAFLFRYPYCYGYWKKYADLEKKKGAKEKCMLVFERGIKAIPLSADLWIHYLNHVRNEYADQPEFIRAQYERAIEGCGREWKSDKLWDHFVKWEVQQPEGGKERVLKLYDRILANQTQGLSHQFDMFREFVKSNVPKDIMPVQQFLDLRKQVLQTLEKASKTEVSAEEENQAMRESIIFERRKLFKETEEKVQARWKFEDAIKRPYFHMKPLERSQLKNWAEYLRVQSEKNKDLMAVETLYERCMIACALYEEFWLKYVEWLEGLLVKAKDAATAAAAAVKSDEAAANDKEVAAVEENEEVAKEALDQGDTKAASEEVESENKKEDEGKEEKKAEEEGDEKKEPVDPATEEKDKEPVDPAAKPVDSKAAEDDKKKAKKEEEAEPPMTLKEDEIVEKIRGVFVRACVHHLPAKISLHMAWSAFEERQGDIDKASEILQTLEGFHPQMLSIMLKRINLERRRGNEAEVHNLFKVCIDRSVNKAGLASELSVKYARYLRLSGVGGDAYAVDASMAVLRQALDRDPRNAKLYLQLLDIELHRTPRMDHHKVMAVFDDALKVEGWSQGQRLTFLQRKLDYLEDFGDSICQVSEAQQQVNQLRVQIKDAASKSAGNSNNASDSSSLGGGRGDRRRKDLDSSSRKSGGGGGVNGSSGATTYSATNSASYNAHHTSQYQQYGSRYSGGGQSQYAAATPSSYNQYGSYYQGYYPQ